MLCHLWRLADSESCLAHRCIRTESSTVRMFSCMLIPHKDHNKIMQVYSVTVMTHVTALEAGHLARGHLKLSLRHAY